jgi:O-antigen biosynthesis protein
VFAPKPAPADFRETPTIPGIGRARPVPHLAPFKVVDRARPSDDRVRVDGKFFALGDRRFTVRGVTYGTFEPREGDGARFPRTEVAARDLAAMAEAGFNVVRTYTTPPEDVIELAAEHELRLLAGVFYPDWRYLLDSSRREQRRIAREARSTVARAARRLSGCPDVLGLSLGNEVPADVLRWFGTDVVADTIRELADAVRDVDPHQLVTYANYPTAEYLPLETLDFLTFNVFLEQREDFRRYLTRLHHLAGDRPLVLGEVGIDAGTTPEGERYQAEVVEWQLETALERGVAGTCVFSWTDEWWVGDAKVEGWHFGLTDAQRRPRPTLEVAARWNRRSVRDLPFPWPSMSVVVCAYNAEATLDECLRHTCTLDYPDLEVIVVDDGSTDATAEIARRHPRARLVSIEHAGLSVARNEGLHQARGELVAYLDSDAYPSTEWPYYLALGLDASDVGGVGGPNLPPPDDPIGAHMVARAPGGPVHVLVSDDRAEHVPGCNMAFWRKVLEEVGGFDPIYTSAGDDVDVCWKVLNRDWEIAFHPAALVWHHRRPGLRAYLRQQRGYGRSEALVEARHPQRFTSTGTARWRGRIYDSLTPSVARQRIYRGLYGAAAYQSVYQGGGHLLDLVHQIGLPIALGLVATAPFGLLSPWFALPALLALAMIVGVAAVDMGRTAPPRGLRTRRLRFRAGVAAHHLLQPLVRTWGRHRSRPLASRDLSVRPQLPDPVRRLPGGVLVLPEDRPRADLAATVVTELRRAGSRIISPSGWEDFDARLVTSTFVTGDLQTSSHPEGFVQLRIRPRLRRPVVIGALGAAAGLVLLSPALALAAVVLTAAEVGRGRLRCRRLLRRAVTGGRGERAGAPLDEAVHGHPSTRPPVDAPEAGDQPFTDIKEAS